MKYTGGGRKKILAIGEAPGVEEDNCNEQFVGKAGKRQVKELKRLGIDFNRDCWKTNAIRCHIEDNETPDSKQIDYCRPALFAEIRKLKPVSILLFGSVAAEAVLGHLWGKGGKFVAAKWRGWVIPHQELNCWISAHYHPSYLNRKKDGLLDILYRRGLKEALKKRKRPWTKVPNYEDEVELIYKPPLVA
jgi:DNA polymerase